MQSWQPRSSHAVSDEDFDQIYLERVRCASGRHWAPVEVAGHAADVFGVNDRTRVLEVGWAQGGLVWSKASPALVASLGSSCGTVSSLPQHGGAGGSSVSTSFTATCSRSIG